MGASWLARLLLPLAGEGGLAKRGRTGDDPDNRHNRSFGLSHDRLRPILADASAIPVQVWGGLSSRKREKARAAKTRFASVVIFAGTCLALQAQEASKPRLPDLFDPNQRVQKPDAGQVKSIRFLTTDDFPPFHFALPDGTLAGLDIDLARAICSDLQLACTIQSRRFDTLIPQIKQGKDDALIAAVANTPGTRAELDFTAPYYTTPARFVAARNSKLDKMTPAALAGHTVGVESGTAHQAYLKTFFPKAILKAYPTAAALRTALQKGEIEAMFGDGIALAVWLNSEGAKACCSFRDGPFTESRFFGNGVSIAVAKGNKALQQALDYELAHLAKNGTFADLYLKYFPVGFY